MSPLLKAPLWQQSRIMIVRAADDNSMNSLMRRELTAVERSRSVLVSRVHR
jgi:hypothetical protein